MKNLRKVLLFLSFVLSSALIFAQGDIRFGARVGANFANVSLDGVDTKSRTALVFGGLADIPISDMFSVQPEIQLAQKGFQIGLGLLGVGVETTTKITYLEIPIHAKYVFSQSDNMSIFGLAGPSVGFALSGSVEACAVGVCTDEDINFKDDGFNSIDFGLSFGAGVLIKNNIMVDLRYILGLSDLNDTDSPDQTISSKNRVLQVGVGYMF